MEATDDRALDLDIDDSAALDAALKAVEGTLYAFVAYTSDDYRIAHVDDSLMEMYRDDAQMYDHFETIHSYVHIDFMEREMFENELFPAVGPVRSFITQMQSMTVIRVIRGDGGLFLAVEPDEPVSSLVDAVEAAI